LPAVVTSALIFHFHFSSGDVNIDFSFCCVLPWRVAL